MEHRRLGRTGLHVSAIGLGTMTWGRETDAQDAAEQLSDFADAGGTLVDTAGSYADGGSEEILGSLVGSVVHRDDLVLATKGGLRRSPQGTVVDSSRRALLSDLDASLARLGTDHVDLFLVQAPDLGTPLDETVAALAHAVSSGRTRYVGLSNHSSWHTGYVAGRLAGSDGPGLAAVEVEHSLLAREVERSTVPASQALGVGVLGWSALGRGVLTGKYRGTVPPGSRGASAHLAGFVEPYLSGPASSVVDALCTAASGLGRAPLEVALAWLLERGYLSSAIVGARTPAQLREILGADGLELPSAVSQALDDVSAPPA
jgi:aryl-alcohol dehydrogenase-like predicted oxidoreductase